MRSKIALWIRERLDQLRTKRLGVMRHALLVSRVGIIDMRFLLEQLGERASIHLPAGESRERS